MNTRAIRLVFVKEVREILRDRRTLFLMIGIPVFLYPILFVITEQVMIFGQDRLGGFLPRVAIEQPEGAGQPLPLDGGTSLDIVITAPGAAREALATGRVDAVVIPAPSASREGAVHEVQVLFDASRDRSLLARSAVGRRLEALNDDILAERLADLGLPRGFIRPVMVRDSSVATARGLGGAALGRFLPMILIVMTVLGAFHPAVDIAAGERERRTLEPLLTTRVPSSDIVLGKYLAVALMSFTAAALNLTSMLLTLNSGIFQFADQFGLDFELPPLAIVFTLGLLSLLAFLFSALFLGVAVHAQSFREAQTSLAPIYIVSLLPAMVTMVPGLELTVGLAIVPVAGIALLFRELMIGEPARMEGFIAIAATIGYASLALSFAARSFDRGDLLLGDDEDAAARGVRRAWWNRAGAQVPTRRGAMVFVALIALLYFHFGTGLNLLGERGLLASQWLLLALPATLFIGMGRFSWRETFALRPAPPLAFAAGLLIAFGAIPLGWTIGWLQSFVLEIPESLLGAMQGLLTAEGAGRTVWLLFLVALTPAICEELVFRGILLQSLLRGMRIHAAILTTSVVFGIFHLSFETVIRLLPTMFIGALLALAVARTGSIFVSMLMHFVNNAAAVLLVSAPALQPYLLADNGAPRWEIVALGVLLLAAGVRLLRSPAVRPGPALAADDEREPGETAPATS